MIDLLARALEKLGCRIVINAGGENLVLALGAGTAIPFDPLKPHLGAPAVEIHAQGLPNLLHEAVHVILAQRLDHDHGIDYGAIPFDIESASGRQVWWDELSCCVVSCAYICDPEWDTSVDSWFAEQVEIQPVFYGLEHDPARFFQRAAAWLARDHTTYRATLDRAYARMEQLLRWGGASPSEACPKLRLDAVGLFARQGWTA